MSRRDRRRTRVIAAVLALGLVLPALLTILAATARASTGDGERAVDDGRSVVVLGTTGLQWEDLSALATPALWELAQDGAAANLVVRSVRSSACPADGWLAVSAGRRAADLPTGTWGTCRSLRETAASGAVIGWEDYRTAADEASYDADPGLLGELLAEASVPVAAIGPGAAIALAGRDGVVTGTHLPAPTQSSQLSAVVADAVAGHELVVVDLGSVRDRNRPLVAIPEPVPDDLAEDRTEEPAEEEPTMPPAEGWLLEEPERVEQVATIDARVAAALEGVAESGVPTTVLLASLADSGTAPRMQVAVVVGGDGLLGTRSTRQPGMVQATDVTPTVLERLGLPLPASLAGAPMRASDDGLTGPERVAHLQDVNDHAVAIRPLVGPFYSALVLVNLLLYAAVTLGLNRRVLDRAASSLESSGGTGPRAHGARLRLSGPERALRPVRAAATVVAAVPIASTLANLAPWWRAGAPGLVLYGTTIAVAVGLAAVALLGPWRRYPLAPVAVVAGTTAAVLALDVLSGAQLQVSALMGVQPQVGGRFYGFNNSSFSLFAAATLLVAMVLAEPLVRRGRRRAAAGVVLVVGVTAVALNGLPSIGADFGGPPALIPGVLVLALLTLGVRLTIRRIALVLGVTALLAISFSVVDWLRPAEDRSHLGRFVETVLDGGLVPVVVRKAEQNLTNLFGSTLTLLAIGGIVLVVVVLTRPLRRARNGDGDDYAWLGQGRHITEIESDLLLLRPALVAISTTLAIGFAVNDSGIVIPAIGISLAVPLLVAALAGWFLSGQDSSVAAPAPGSAVPSPPERGVAQAR